MISMNNTAIAAVMMAAASAFAASVDLEYTGVAGGTGATTARVNNLWVYAGHMQHVYTSGARAGQSFNSFCIDVNEHANPGSGTYQIIDLADAPVPGTPFGDSAADAVSAVVANAIALGWIGTDLQGDAAQTGYLAKMGAIQAAIWDALGFNMDFNSSMTSSSLRNYHDILMDSSTFDSSLRTLGLAAIVAPGEQDMLYIVPLPPGALAGAGVLAMAFGVRSLRRR